MKEKKIIKEYLKLTDSYNKHSFQSQFDDYNYVRKIIVLIAKIFKKRRSLILRFISTTQVVVPTGFTQLGLFVNAGICKYYDNIGRFRLFQGFLINSPSKFIIFESNTFRHKIYLCSPVIIAIKNGYFDVLIDLLELGARKSDIHDEFYEYISEGYNIKHSKIINFCARCSCRSYQALNEMTPIEKCLFLSTKVALNDLMAHIINSSLFSEISYDCWRIIFLDMLLQNNIEVFIYFISISFDLNLFGDGIVYGMINGFIVTRDYYLLEYSKIFYRERCITPFRENIKINYNKILELIFYSGYDYTYEELLHLTDNSHENGLMQLRSKPISLQNICRKIVRWCIRIHGHNMQHAINSLPIMPGLKPFLNMKDSN